ncbi:MAG: DNA repair protein RecN [Ruminococcaceae bacterium]|nr:DNA repair protein RecN [Oscillospiraceae bacterium]
MLYNLSINDIAIIKQAEITFENGFNVLTGETGAGKSIIIDSINAILGGRTSKEIIRTGAARASVFASFYNVNKDIINSLAEQNIDISENTVELQRIINSDGRTICKINGTTVSGSFLKEIGKSLITIHGQLDNQALLNPEMHCSFIDKLADNENILSSYKSEYDRYCSLLSKIKSLDIDQQSKERRIEVLNYQIDEIEKADIKIGETEQLKNQRDIIRNSEKILCSLNNAYNAINGSDDFSGAELLAREAANEISEASKYLSEAENISEEITDISYQLSDVSEKINSIVNSIEYDPNLLEQIEERLDLIYNLTKKYGSDESEILSFLANAKAELDSIVLSDEQKEQLKADLSACKEELRKRADCLTKSRTDASNEFSKKVVEVLKFLEMPSVMFSVSIKKCEYNENGQDEIEFLLSANKGEDLKPLSKIASGGELSRIMLAIKSVLADKDDIDTLIFDEIDTGVSGRAAQKVALKMKEVSLNRQVICVTHLASIASLADSHFLIEKYEKDDKTFTKVTKLDYNGRVGELSRIIGGINITDETVTLAKQMLEG